MAQLNYNNYVSLDPKEPVISGNSIATIKVAAEIKLFKQKYTHQENDTVLKGNDVGFTIVFGNDGELSWKQPIPNIPTLEDTLEIVSPISLKVMSLSIPCYYQLWIIERDGVKLTNPRQLSKCDVLNHGLYVFQLRKLVDNLHTPYFDIPCHSIESFSILFQVEFPACPSCPNDCTTIPVYNGDFEIYSNTPNVISSWVVTLPPSGNPFAQTVPTSTLINPNNGYTIVYTPISGYQFVLLKTDGPSSYTSISQTIEVCPGDKIEGYSFFFTEEPVGVFFVDNAKVEILDSTNVIIATPFNQSGINLPPAYGSTNWQYWSYTFATGGIYTLRCGVANSLDSIGDSYMGIDSIKII